jgi:exonuclease SbcC
VARAEAEGKRARAAADAAAGRVAELDATVRELDRTLTAARTEADLLTARLAELDTRLADAPGAAALRHELTAITRTERRLGEAAAEVRRAREAHRRARAGVTGAEQRLRTASASRVVSNSRQAVRSRCSAAVTAAETGIRRARDELADRFTAAGLAPPDDDEEVVRAATVAAERARADLDQLRDRRQRAERLRERRADHERDAQVARALAQHLRANNFEAWLLEEALDRLVEGGSAILRDLSGGQYDLVHDGRELFVADHYDAGLRRPVRTLSGGETFQASLALALALAEQLAGVSTRASLESIMLDEGFGTLDATTLDAVAATLENLAARGDRMVGVVTHVPALAERIPVRFEVTKDARSARVTRVGL